jgi:hypothetical protein
LFAHFMARFDWAFVHLPPGAVNWSSVASCTEERALAVAPEAERHAAEVAGGAAGGLDSATRATRTIKVRALGDCEPVGGRVYAHGTMGGYTQAKCPMSGRFSAAGVSLK